MGVKIVEVRTGRERKAFVKLPFSIYKGNPYWIPPLIRSAVNDIDPAVNPFFKGCDAKFWMAYKNGKIMGRIGAIIHHPHNAKTGERFGRITRPEFFDDAEVVDALFQTAENWIREQGMEAVVGPLGFSNVDTQALLVEGFDQLPSVASVYHLPYYQSHFERLGYKKLIDWVEFNLYLEPEVPEKAVRLSKLVKERYGFTVEEMKSQEMLRANGKDFFRIFNTAFNDLFSFTAFDDAQVEYVLDNYLSVINPEFVHIVRNENHEMVGAIIPVPSLSRAMQKADGRLWRGLPAIIRSRKKNNIIDLFLTGVLPEYQPKGVASLLIAETYPVMVKYGMITVDTTGMLENNQKAIQNWKQYSHEQNKRKRCYIKYFDEKKQTALGTYVGEDCQSDDKE
ncbi:MAG: hypothetical protein J5792_03070 [Bacteroidales bacterium]|nr:hypothetical protein [Bacteroidales bacterium]